MKCVLYNVILYCLIYGLLIKSGVPGDMLQPKLRHRKPLLHPGTYSLFRLIFVPEMSD